MFSEETNDRITAVTEFGKNVVYYGYIPLILYLGVTNSSPRPNLLRLFLPMA
ncbi:hypothetical protein BC828DRAFT_393613 [Blastocladiella britannica]|nr:hypothetical protein BC828DRAFT_393613 [Blastocladiella britannica]